MKSMIADGTLACLDRYDADPWLLFGLFEALDQLPVSALEMSAAVYEKLRSFDIFSGTDKQLRLRCSDEAGQKACPGFDGYIVLDHSPESEEELVFCRSADGACLFRRRQGFDALVGILPAAVFHQLLQQDAALELAPMNRCHAATAMAVEWCRMGGRRVLTALNGLGGLACSEEVLMALYIRGQLETDSLQCLQDARVFLEAVMQEKIPPKKAVLGSEIFAVEAGIHVDGITKNPQLYEPYEPSFAGLQRHIVVGKHSGRQALLAKAAELHVGLGADPDRILMRLQQRCTCQERSLSDDEFRRLLRDAL